MQAEGRALNDFIERVKAKEQPRRCNISKELADLSPKREKEILEALNDRELPASAIAQVLEEEAINISVYTIRRCRRSCNCGLLSETE